MAVILPPVDRCERDLSPLFYPPLQQPIAIDLDPGLYEAERLRCVFRGFSKLAAALTQAKNEPASFGAIGAFGGAELLAASRIFPTLRRLVLADSHPAGLARAATNVAAHIDPEIELAAYGSSADLLSAAERGARVDLLYANLIDPPRRPSPAALADRLTGCRPVAGSVDDEWLNRCQLALPYRFLSGIRALLSPDGMALVLLSGRAGPAAFARIARAAHVQLEPVICGFTRQMDPSSVLPRYAAAETLGIGFDFYDFERGTIDLASRPDGDGPALLAGLAACRLSAFAALHAHQNGTTIGHTYYLMKAVPVRRTGANGSRQ
jgi:hypothetical protein